MAANINLHQPRVDYAHAERDDENSQGEGTTADSQTPAQSDASVSAPTEQQGQSGDGAGGDAGTQDASTPPPPPTEPNAPKPNFARYGVGDTVIMGRPDYGRAYAVSSNRFEPPEPAERTPAADAKPLTKPGSENLSATRAIPMPKPGSGMSPTTISAPLEAPITLPSPTTNAPRVGGEAVTAPAASAATSEAGNSDLAFERGMADLTLGDPLNKELIARYEQEHPGSNLVEHGNGTADHLVATYGEARLNDMAKLHQALAGVRDDYNNALTAAEARGPSFDNAAFWKSPQTSSGDGGGDAPIFDNAAFTRWYVEQDGLSNRAFAANYAYGGVGTATYSQGDNTNPIEATLLSGGTSVIVHQRMETSSEGGTTINVPRFAAPGLFILGGPTSGIELHDPKAVWFDPTLGFVTSETNVVVKDDFADKYMMVIIVTAVTAGAGSLGLLPTAATFGGGTSGAILAGAANSVITSTLVTAAQGGDITFKGMFQAALTGGFMGGLTSLSGYRDFSNLGLDTTTNTVTNYALRALSITGHATLQGALRELVGGRFRDGFTESLVQGLAGEITRVLNNDIAGRLTRGEITAEQGRFLNEMSRATGSALRAAANPDNPGYAFAQDYLTQLLGPGGTVTAPEVRGTVFDDDGNLTPGFVDPNASIAIQQQQLRSALTRQGMDASSIESLIDFQTERWENADYASQANTALNRSIDTSAPMDVQTRQLRLILAAEGFDAARIDDRVNLYVQQRQTSADIDSFEAMLNAPLNPQLASTDPRSAAFILDNPLLTLSQKVFLIDKGLYDIGVIINDLTAKADAAAARGDQAGADAWNGQAGTYRRYQTEYIASRSVVGIAREAQGAAESLYSNTAGYSRQQIDEAMLRLISQRRQTGGVDEWMSQQLLRNNPITYATLVDPENTTALAQAVGQLGVGLGSIRGITRAGGRLPTLPEPNQANGGNNNLPPPRMRSAKDVIGTSEGGNGVWIREPVPAKGADYQEQITGVERGTAYYVKGTKFDGIYPAEKVLVDAKDWVGYAPVGSNGQLQSWFVKGTLEQAEKQLRSAAGSGYSVRWTVPDEASAARLREVFRTSKEPVNIQIVVVPKK
jgi:Restriction endonuclease fold toxin 5